MFNLLIYKHNNLELKEIYTMGSKQVHNVYRFMYHYICKLRINLISQYFPLFCQPWKQSISIGSLLCTRISVTIILMKITWLFHLCLSWLHDHNVHYGLGQPIHSSPGTLEACTNSFLKHTWGSNFDSFPTLMYFWN